MPFRAGPQEAGHRGIVQTGTKGRHRFQKRQCNGRSSQIEQAQHAWSVSAEAVITVEHMVERIVGHGGGQPGCHCNKGF